MLEAVLLFMKRLQGCVLSGWHLALWAGICVVSEESVMNGGNAKLRCLTCPTQLSPPRVPQLAEISKHKQPRGPSCQGCLHGMKRPSGHRNFVTIIDATGKTKKRSKRNKKNGQSDDVLVHLSQSPAKMLDMTKQVLEDLGLMKGCAIEAQPTKYKPKAQRAGAVTMGSDCSGLGTERYALRLAGIKVVNKFASEINPHVQAMYQAIHGTSDVIQKDATSSHQGRGYVDVYVAGPPCQSWSSMGKRLGLADLKGRGIVV